MLEPRANYTNTTGLNASRSESNRIATTFNRTHARAISHRQFVSAIGTLMDRDATQIYCPNTSCQAPNAERSKFCQRCRTLLPKRYLWAIETGTEREPLPPVLEDRYVLSGDRVYLDTHPGLLPHVPETVPDEIRAYLKLFPYRWNVPQIYGSAGWPSVTGHAIWLLENAPIERRTDDHWRPFDRIAHAWGHTDDLHRLGWLWQLANLWDAFRREGVASTLLDPQQIRIEGSFVRIAQLLSDDGRSEPTFDKVGHLWSRWIPATKSPLRDFFASLCQLVIDRQLQTPRQVQQAIDRAIDRLQPTREYRWQVATLSDRGPSRSRNEDACFPLGEPPDQTGPQVLGIVCDGVGGHEGGDIASSLAIETVASQVGSPDDVVVSMLRADKAERVRSAIAEANDAIGQRNNSEQRQGRQRMGTTLVMGQGDRSDLWISHIGDSRAYLVNRNAFYALTVDDDVASRDVRLGYAFYRAAVHQPTAGSLVQALGMSASTNLYPTIQRFILNEDSVILLCSDGLSDYDRVEQHWQSELQPLLDSGMSLTGAAHRLVEIANTQNGHDNVTVALLRLQVKPAADRAVDAAELAAELAACLQPLPEVSAPEDERAVPSGGTTIVAKRKSPLLRDLLLFATIAIAGFAGFRLFLNGGGLQTALEGASDMASVPDGDGNAETAAEPVAPPTARSGPSSRPFAVGQQLALQEAVVLRADKLDTAPPLDRAIAAGAIVEVTAIDKTVDRHWLQLKFCPPDTRARGDANVGDANAIDNAATPPDSATASAGSAGEASDTVELTVDRGWIDVTNFQAASYEPYEPPPGQPGACDR